MASPSTAHSTSTRPIYTRAIEKSPAADKLNYRIQRNAHESKWLAGYNGLSTSVIGLKMKEEARVPAGLVADRRPRSGRQSVLGHVLQRPTLARGQQREAGRRISLSEREFDGSRAGQWDNSQGYLGISNPVYGTLTFGRTNSLALDVTWAYDPVASTAFSTLGFSAAFAGFGTSPTARPNTAFTYRLTYQNFRAAVQAQIGGYGSATPQTACIRGSSAQTSGRCRSTAF